MYEIFEHELGRSIKWTKEDGTICFIPFAEENPDYQDYLKWLDNQ